MDDELTAEAGEPLREALWSVLDGWTRERKARFVHFVTGSDRLPVPGMELLRIEMPFIAIGAKDHKKTLGMLPQAHTCENILELPNYWQCMCALRGVDEHGGGEDPAEFAALKKELLKTVEARFRLAVENCDSYGLDDGVGGGPVSFGGGGGGGGASWGGVNGGSHQNQRQPTKLSVSSGGAAALGLGFGGGSGGGASFQQQRASAATTHGAPSPLLVPLPRNSFGGGGGNDGGGIGIVAAPPPPLQLHQLPPLAPGGGLPPLRAGHLSARGGAPPPMGAGAAGAAGGAGDDDAVTMFGGAGRAGADDAVTLFGGDDYAAAPLFGEVNRSGSGADLSRDDDEDADDAPRTSEDKLHPRASTVDEDIAWLENL